MKRHTEVPELPGWLTAVQAAEHLGITRQSVTRMMGEGTFRTLRAVGDRPLFVVRVEEVMTYGKLYLDNGRSWAKAAELLASAPPRQIGLDRIGGTPGRGRYAGRRKA